MGIKGTMSGKKLIKEKSPQNFEFLKRNRWVYNMPNIEPYFAKSIILPLFKSTTFLSPRRLYSVTFYNPVFDSFNKDLLKMINDKFDASINFSDNDGNVVECWKFLNVKIVNIEPQNSLSYELSGPMLTDVIFSVKQNDIKISTKTLNKKD